MKKSIKIMVTMVLLLVLPVFTANAIDWEEYPPAQCGDGMCEPKPTECPEDCEDIRQIMDVVGLPGDWKYDGPGPVWSVIRVILPIGVVLALIIMGVLFIKKKEIVKQQRKPRKKSSRKKLRK